jgi:serine/threonine protein phosphatase PrpC
MKSLSMNEKKAKFSTGFMTEAGTKITSRGYFGSVEQAGLACWIVAEQVDALEDKESAKIAVERILGNFSRGPSMAKAKIKEYLLDAHQKLKDESKTEMLKANLVMVVTDYAKAVWTVIGNVRLYHFREGRFSFRSKDQTIAQVMVDSGLLAEDEVNQREERNNLINYLGGITEFKPFISEPFHLQDGDVLLLCNSGVWEKIKNAEIVDCLRHTSEPREFMTAVKSAGLVQGSPGLKNYTMGVIFTQQVWSENNSLDYRKVIFTKLQKSLQRIITSVFKSASKIVFALQRVRTKKATAIGNHIARLEEPKGINVKTTGTGSTTRVGLDLAINSDPIRMKNEEVILPTQFVTEAQISRDVRSKNDGVILPSHLAHEEIKEINVRVKDAVMVGKSSPKKVTNLSLSPIKMANITTKTNGMKCIDSLGLAQWLVIKVAKLTTLPLRFDAISHKKVSLCCLALLVIISFGWLFNQRVAAIKTQKTLEAQRQIMRSQQRTPADHEHSGDQMANDGLYQAALLEYQAALQVLEQLRDSERQARLAKKAEVAGLIIDGDNFTGAGEYDAALQAYVKADLYAAGIDCLQNGLTKKIAWIQQRIVLSNLESTGDEEVNRENYLGARGQYQAALQVANQIACSERVIVLTEKLTQIEQKLAELTRRKAAAINGKIATRRKAKTLYLKKTGGIKNKA